MSLDCVLRGKGIPQNKRLPNMPRTDINKVSDCQFICQKHPQCKGFSYTRPTSQLSGKCYLASEYLLIDQSESYAGTKFCGKCFYTCTFHTIVCYKCFDTGDY